MNWSNPSVCPKPGSPPNVSNQETLENESGSDCIDVCTDNNCQADNHSPPKRRLWYDELRIFKELGLDRIALVASNECKRCLRNERNHLDNEPELADTVPQSHDELEADLKAFQERIKHQKPKFAYKDPGKYQHLME